MDPKPVTTLIPTDENVPHSLGRAGVWHDPRNRDYRALVVAPPRNDRPNEPWWTRDVYNQDPEPSCVAQMGVGLMRTSPLRHGFDQWGAFDDYDERQQLYLECQHHDPWAGTNYDGTSTDAVFKVLRLRGAISGWRWLFGEKELREWVTWYGPAGVGTIWTWDMFTPDRKGFIHPTGNTAGGHAYRVVQFSAAQDAYRIVNSWGKRWGQNGRAWISRVDMAALLAAQGEAATIA